MPKESIPPKIIPTRRTPRRSEHFAPLDETVPSSDLDPEERLIAKESGRLEEPKPMPVPVPVTDEHVPTSELPENVTVTQDSGEVSIPNLLPGRPLLGTPRQKHLEEMFAPGKGGAHHRGGKLVAHEGHGKHGRKPERPKGASSIRETEE